jgi:hypothetical protein
MIGSLRASPAGRAERGFFWGAKMTGFVDSGLKTLMESASERSTPQWTRVDSMDSAGCVLVFSARCGLSRLRRRCRPPARYKRARSKAAPASIRTAPTPRTIRPPLGPLDGLGALGHGGGAHAGRFRHRLGHDHLIAGDAQPEDHAQGTQDRQGLAAAHHFGSAARAAAAVHPAAGRGGLGISRPASRQLRHRPTRGVAQDLGRIDQKP